jgi:hypothetical protein
MWLSASRIENSRLALTTRVLGAFLLATIVWGSTFESTHHHGVGLVTRSQRVTTETQTNGNQEAASRQLPPLSSRTRTAECSICQLQQNLATTLISEPARASADAGQSAPQPTFIQIELAEFTRSQHGRAPPTVL